MLTSRQEECRFLRKRQNAVPFQIDAVYSKTPENPEHTQNAGGCCKTFSGDAGNGNPGALAGATGAKRHTEAKERQGQHYLKKGLDTTPFADRHQRAARMIRDSLAADCPPIWEACGAVLAARLTGAERVFLAFAALRALDSAPREAVFDLAHYGRLDARDPGLSGVSIMAEARAWAGQAERTDLKAYCAATFQALGDADRAAFLQRFGGGCHATV